MKYTFPHFTSKPEYIQPDYKKWMAVEIGMSRDEVITLLGSPLDDEYHGGKAHFDDSYYSYGYLQMPMLPHPRTYTFLIGFDANNKVAIKSDPFNGRFSADGVPTAPELIIPQNQTIFSHYPRIIDIRWYPSSGIYPLTYIVELGVGLPFGDTKFNDEEIESDLPIPFFITTFVGAQPGRFRVKAKNQIGESGWSEYCYFEFTV